MDGPVDLFETDTVTQIETNLDDLSPEIMGAMIERLLAAGALDVFLLPAQMKKNRPGTLLTVLCEPAALGRLAELIFRETTAFGVRFSEKRRLKLARRIEKVVTASGEIEVKLGFDLHGRLLQVAPEFESCRSASERTGQPLREIYHDAIAAYRAKSA